MSNRTSGSASPRRAGRTEGQPVRVLMVCPRFLPDVGGTETHVHEVSRRLIDRGGFEITVLTTDRTHQRAEHEVIDGIEVVRVPSWPRSRDYYLAPGIPAVIRRGTWDIVHAQGIHTPVPLQAMRTARRLGIPYMVTFHTGGHSSGIRNAIRSTQWRIAGHYLRDAAALIGVSRFEARSIGRQAGIGAKPVTVIRNGGALPAPLPGTVAVPGRIVSSGRLERYKGHQRVIEALPHVAREVPETRLLILGSGPYEGELRKLASDLGVSDRVEIKHLASSDRQGMATTLAEANVVAAMSDYEAHPVAVMEALGVGRPVVGYDVAGIGDLVEEGWVRGVAPGSPATLVARELIAAMSSPSKVDPAELPSWDSCTDQLAQVYIAALGIAPGLTPEKAG